MDRLASAAASSDPILDWIAAGRPYLGICLGLQLLFETSDEDGAETLGVLPGRTERLADAPTLPHIGWNQVDQVRDHPLLAGIADGADFYFVHSYAGGPGRGPAAVTATLATTSHGRPFVSAVARDRRPRRPVPSGTERAGRPAPARQRRRARPVSGVPATGAVGLMLRRRVIPCLDVANGRVVKGTRFVDLVDEGDPPELAERYAAEGADELVFLDISAAPEGRGTLLDIVERTARRAFIPLTVGGGVRAVRRHARGPPGRRRQGVAQHRGGHGSRPHQPCAARFGRQAVVVAIDARRRPA